MDTQLRLCFCCVFFLSRGENIIADKRAMAMVIRAMWTTRMREREKDSGGDRAEKCDFLSFFVLMIFGEEIKIKSGVKFVGALCSSLIPHNFLFLPRKCLFFRLAVNRKTWKRSRKVFFFLPSHLYFLSVLWDRPHQWNHCRYSTYP